MRVHWVNMYMYSDSGFSAADVVIAHTSLKTQQSIAVDKQRAIGKSISAHL